MDLIAIIPARSGSKGIKGKNLVPLNGVPLLEYSIKAAQGCQAIAKVYVSSDSDDILSLAEKCGALPLKRPKVLALDHSKSTEVITHVLEQLMHEGETVKNFVLLQPTSPLRKAHHIDAAWKLFLEKKASLLVSVFSPPLEILKAFIVDKRGYLKGAFGDLAPFTPRQELPTAYLPNGAIYICSVDKFLEHKDFPKEHIVPFIMEAKESIDIDTPEDLSLAEKYLKADSPKVVVTGASGFIGRALVPALVERGIEVTAVSRNATQFKGAKNLQVKAYEDTPHGEVLIHLAENADIKKANDMGEDYIAIACGPLKKLLDKNFSHVIYSSSAVIYGDKSDHSHSPDEELAPVEIYAKSKLACEKLVLEQNGTVFRLSNVIGPEMSSNIVLSDILKTAVKGKIEVRSKAPIRDFIWIDDVVEAIVKATRLKPPGVFNLASGISVSVGELAHLVEEELKLKKSPLVSSTETHSCLKLDISKTKTTLNWFPKTSLKEGISKLLGKKT